MWSLYGFYFPTVPEVLIAIGVVSVGAIIFWAIAQKTMFAGYAINKADSAEDEAIASQEGATPQAI